MNVLISAAGRRVRLVQFFREALRELGLNSRVFACDVSPAVASLYVADGFFLTPPADDARFIPAVLDKCAELDIRLLLSVHDHELIPYADARDRFEQAGVYVAIPGPEAVRIARDKRACHAWLVRHGFPVAHRWLPEDTPTSLLYPVVVKPAQGSAGRGVVFVRNARELDQALCATQNPVIEELLTGDEFTVNVLASRDGQLVCAVPHLRLEVRSGEVSKGRTFHNEAIEAIARRLVELLPRCRGPLNFQGFLTPAGDVKLSEINPRFGGGYPLAQAAGARFPEWLLAEACGRSVQRGFVGWRPGVVMLRYDHEVIVHQAAPKVFAPL
ncbi:MAG: ATP-grasp domain-containing protein [Planctomycetes bacterium]|nr:ATP-grasp domain-containing protein [Planctomycetota bacterium]